MQVQIRSESIFQVSSGLALVSKFKKVQKSVEAEMKKIIVMMVFIALIATAVAIIVANRDECRLEYLKDSEWRKPSESMATMVEGNLQVRFSYCQGVEYFLISRWTDYHEVIEKENFMINLSDYYPVKLFVWQDRNKEYKYSEYDFYFVKGDK